MRKRLPTSEVYSPNDANLDEKRKLLLAMLDGVYVDAKEEKRVVAIRPKPAFCHIFQVATTRKGSEVVLIKEPQEQTAPEARSDPCFWWRRGRDGLCRPTRFYTCWPSARLSQSVVGRCKRRPHGLRLPTTANDPSSADWSCSRGNYTDNRAVAIHNHSQDSAQPFVKPLVLSFSTSRYPSTTFGDFIKKARLEKGLRQTDVARMIGVDEQTVTNWERSVNLPRQFQKVKSACQMLSLDYGQVVQAFHHKPDGNQAPGDALLKARIKKGLTQEEAARMAGIDPGTLARWEKADSEPPKWIQEKLFRLHAALDL